MTHEQFLLMKLAEECAEVAQRAIKQMQFGAEQIQKANEVTGGLGPAPKEVGLTNSQRLSNELTDLYIIARLLEKADEIPGIDFDEFLEAEKVKIEKLNKYLAFARSNGSMDGDWTI